MPRPLDLRPMQDFDPSQPAWVYDELNDQVFVWRPEEWLAGWREHATPNDAEGAVIEWDGLLLAGWLPR